MTKTHKTEREVEIHEFYVFRTTSGSLPALCVECSSGDAFMVAPEQAAALSHVPLRTIYRAVEGGLLHYTERPDGSLVVCLRSLNITRNQITDDKLITDGNVRNPDASA